MTPDGVFWGLWIAIIIVTSLLSLSLLALLCTRLPSFLPSKSKLRYRIGSISAIFVVLLFMVQGFIITGGLECSGAPLFRADHWIPWLIYGVQGLLAVVCIYLVRLLSRKWQKAVADSEVGSNDGNDEEQGDSGTKTPAPETVELEHVEQSETLAQASGTRADEEPPEIEAAAATSHGPSRMPSPLPMTLPMTQATARKLYRRTSSEVTKADWQNAIQLPISAHSPQGNERSPAEDQEMVAAARSLAADIQGFPFPIMPAERPAPSAVQTPDSDDTPEAVKYPSLDREDSAVFMDQEGWPQLQRCPPRTPFPTPNLIISPPTPPNTPVTAAAPCA
ncbi:MAG: hypothetical protein Q9191_007795 [Dirinaria sp. TL-2023a]